ALYCLNRDWYPQFALAFSVACLIKYQPLLAAPFFIIYLITRLLDQKQLLRSGKNFLARIILPGITPWLLAFMIFGTTMLHSLLSLTGGAWLSAQALNANWIVTRYLLQSGFENPFPPASEASLAMIRAIPEIPGLWADRSA